MSANDYEDFSDAQHKILEKYVTNTRSHIFVLRNLPEVIKGAIFSKYSRSNLGLRTLLLKEFISNEEETAFRHLSGDAFTENLNGDVTHQDQINAVKKAQSFYDRILDGYGDDSIGELGGAHLALENISMLAAKGLEDCRIGGSPLEKSTRYIYFDQKVKGDYLFYREPILMTSAYRDLFISTSNLLFETYGKLIGPLTVILDEKMPKDSNLSKTAYNAALRAKVLDCLRGLLPAGTLTNMGIHGNGRFFEQLIHKMHCNNLAELQDIGKEVFEELSKVIPSFVRRADLNHHTHKSYAQFYETMRNDLKGVTKPVSSMPAYSKQPLVELISCDVESVSKVAAALLFEQGNQGLRELNAFCKQLSEEELGRLLDAGCNARETRRHKSPRALEHANFTFEITADFGVYRDLHRHRLLTQERQLLSCHYGYYTPIEIVGTSLESDYHEAIKKAKEAYDTIAAELPEEAQYIVPMAFHVRWYFHINLRALQWLCELRSQSAGHPTYRLIAQDMAKKVIELFPEFERFFKFVDFEGYELGRLGQEVKKAEKSAKA